MLESLTIDGARDVAIMISYCPSAGPQDHKPASNSDLFPAHTLLGVQTHTFRL